jgi:hypothetical protein
MGRVEWAWVAALGILSALAVVRMAQLDIGFAVAMRSANAGDYPRAHVAHGPVYLAVDDTTWNLRRWLAGAAFAASVERARSGSCEHHARSIFARNKQVKLAGLSLIQYRGFVHCDKSSIWRRIWVMAAQPLGGSGMERTALQSAGVLRRTLDGQLKQHGSATWPPKLPCRRISLSRRPTTFTHRKSRQLLRATHAARLVKDSIRITMKRSTNAKRGRTRLMEQFCPAGRQHGPKWIDGRSPSSIDNGQVKFRWVF